MTKTKLKRVLGLFDTTVAGIGIILGAGIYALIGKAAGIAGNAIWLSFVIGAIVAGLTALSYAELSSAFPKAGAEYVYTGRAFGKRVAFLVNWLLVVGTVFSVATVSLGFAGYLGYFIDLPFALSAAALIILFTALNIYGVKEAVTIANIGSVVEVLGLIIIIAIGLPHIGSVDYLQVPTGGYVPLFVGASLLFFAFLGFESIPRLAEETKDAERVIPKATLLSLGISTAMYILVAIVAVSVLPWQQLAASDAPLADIANALVGSKTGMLLAAIALFATANTVLLMLVTTTRLIYGMSAGGSLFRRFGNVSESRRTPWVSALFLGGLSMVALFMGDISFLAYSADFSVFFTFAVVNLAALWLHYKEPNLKRPFVTPRLGNFPIVPMAGAVSCVILAAAAGITVIAIGIILAAAGWILYELLKREGLVKG